MSNQDFTTADQIEKAVAKAYLTAPITSLDQIVDESTLTFRNEIYEVPPAGTPGGDHNSDSTKPPGLLSGGNELKKTVIGGAVVRNVALVVPGRDAGSFADLPVVPIKGSNNVNAQLLAAALDDRSPGKPNQIPILLLPDEGNLVPVAQPLGSDPPADAGLLSNLITTTADIDKGGSPDEEKKILQQKVGSFVLSGDIDNFFGIKGLTAKLYKFQSKHIR